MLQQFNLPNCYVDNIAGEREQQRIITGIDHSTNPVAACIVRSQFGEYGKTIILLDRHFVMC
jgi:hypothetical protein